MDILKEVNKLDFPIGSYVVVGSGYLIALGLKKGNDVDIVVTKRLFNRCMKVGWEVLPWTYPGTEGQTYLRKGIVELYLSVNCGNYNPTTKELIQRADVMKGVPLASLGDIWKLKKQYLKTKPKHLKDIKLIENYLKSSNRPSRVIKI